MGSYKDLISHAGAFAEFLKNYLKEELENEEMNEDMEEGMLVLLLCPLYKI